MKVTTIYRDTNDVHVATRVIYLKGTDGKAYIDATGTKQFTTSQLREVFQKGAIIKSASGFIYPVEYSETAGVGTVKYLKVGADSKPEFASLSAVAD